MDGVARQTSIPDDKVLIPGVHRQRRPTIVEHPELVAERICRFADIVGRERVIAGTDCGFGTFAGFGAVHPPIAYAKLRSLAEGAAIATKRLGDRAECSETVLILHPPGRSGPEVRRDLEFGFERLANEANRWCCLPGTLCDHRVFRGRSCRMPETRGRGSPT